MNISAAKKSSKNPGKVQVPAFKCDVDKALCSDACIPSSGEALVIICMRM